MCCPRAYSTSLYRSVNYGSFNYSQILTANFHINWKYCTRLHQFGCKFRRKQFYGFGPRATFVVPVKIVLISRSKTGVNFWVKADETSVTQEKNMEQRAKQFVLGFKPKEGWQFLTSQHHLLGLLQCDQMKKLFFQCWAIYYIENMPNVKKLQGRLKNLANFYHFY